MTSRTGPIRTAAGKDLPFHLICPICLQLPKNKVLQCLNGHILCEECQEKVKKACPQCRIPFGRKVGRNIVVENLLDELELGCAYRKKGCAKKLNRKSIDKHIKACEFR